MPLVPTPLGRPIPELSANLPSSQGLYRAARGYYLHPITLATLFVLVPSLRVLGFLPPALAGLGLAPNIAFDLVRVATTVLFGLAILPRLLRWFLARNIPFVVVTFLCAMAVGIPTEIALHYLGHFGTAGREPHSHDPIRVLGLGVILHGIVMIGVRSAVLPHLGRVPGFVPYALPVPIARLREPLAARIDPDVLGHVRALRAANQYVEVMTETGTHLVRIPLKQAIDRLPAASGQRVHRSWWVSSAELHRAIPNYTDGIIKTESGHTYPIGKSHENNVRAFFKDGEGKRSKTAPGQSRSGTSKHSGNAA